MPEHLKFMYTDSNEVLRPSWLVIHTNDPCRLLMSHNNTKVRGVRDMSLMQKPWGHIDPVYWNVRFYITQWNDINWFCFDVFFGGWGFVCVSSGHAHLTDFNIATIIKNGERATALAGTKPYMGNFDFQLHHNNQLVNLVWCHYYELLSLSTNTYPYCEDRYG